MARKKKRGFSSPRRFRRSRRGALKPTHSAVLTLVAIGVVGFILSYSPTGNVNNTTLAQALQGNWTQALYYLGWFLSSNWTALILVLIPVAIIALVIKKFGHKLRISKHWTI